MFSLPGIVIVDNEMNELVQLQESFTLAGLPCLPVHFVNNDPKNKTGMDHIEVPTGLHTRILITDLNLNEFQKLDAKQLVDAISQTIKKFVRSGPYLLILWTKHKEEAGEVVALLEERYKNEITLPIEWSALSKLEFRSEEGGPTIEIADKLKSAIYAIIENSPLFNAILNWEGRVSDAARITSNTLYKITIPLDEPTDEGSGKGYIEQHKNNLIKVLSAIGNEAVGYKNSAEYAASAMDGGLAPVLADQLYLISEIDEVDEVWKQALPGLGVYEDISDNVKSELNSFYHIDEVEPNFSKGLRGVFVRLHPDIIEGGDKKDKFEIRIGRSIKALLHDEFINGNIGTKQERENVRNNTIIGFLEVSAVCDHAQRKTKLHRYLIGALVPVEYENFTCFENNDGVVRKVSHDGIYRFPIVSINGKTFIALFSFKYQFGTHPENNWFGEPIFRIREQIFTDVVFNFSQYSSRPGITRFD